jgi:RNA polymerase sigma-70 factor (ECF subfamily)
LQYAYHRSLNKRRALSAQGVYLWDELDGTNDESFTPEIDTLLYCQQILGQLKPLQRQVIQLIYFEGMTAQEIAILQERSAKNVRHDLYRGLAKLKNSLTLQVKTDVKAESVGRERTKQVVGTHKI